MKRNIAKKSIAILMIGAMLVTGQTVLPRADIVDENANTDIEIYEDDENHLNMGETGIYEFEDGEEVEYSMEDPMALRYVNGEMNEENTIVLSDEDDVVTLDTFSGKSPFKPSSTYYHANQFSGASIEHGIDVSQWNGTIDWKKAKAAGVDYAFVRVGLRYYGSGALDYDSYYIRNIKEAYAAGVDVGVYIYSQAISKAEAEQEARYIISKIAPYKSMIKLPVVLDYEYAATGVGRLYKAHLTKTQATNVCLAFCDYCTSKGYSSMVYANKSMLADSMYADKVSSKYPIWLAQYSNTATYYGDYQYWQYSSTGKVDGIKGDTDVNFFYNQVVTKKIALSDSEKTLAVGGSYTLKATLTPSNTTETVFWSSSKPHVAYVTTGGTVKGVSNGTTTITAMTTSGKKATCVVTVIDDLTAYEIVNLKKEDTYVYTGSDVMPTVKVRTKKKEVVKATANSDITMYAAPNEDYPDVCVIKAGSKIVVKKTKGSFYAGYTEIDGKKYYGYVKSDEVTATSDYRTLTEGTHYYLTVENATKAGTATVNAVSSESGTFVGSISKTFTIAPMDIAQVTYLTPCDYLILEGDEVFNQSPDEIFSVEAQTYVSNLTIKPAVYAYYNGHQLVFLEDYKAYYTNSISDGIGSVRLVGIYNYTGEKDLHYAIVKPGISSFEVKPVYYTGAAVMPELCMMDGDYCLVEGIDYTVEASNNEAAGMAEGVITFAGKYQGTYHFAYEISAKTMELCTVDDIANQIYTGTKVKPKLAVYEGDVLLENGVDYTVKYSNNVMVGMATATIKGIGNYSGTKTVTFSIDPASIERVSVSSISKKIYTGKEIAPSVTVKDGTKELILEQDYTVTYKRNVNTGKASVVITGIGNYNGTKTVTFVIAPKKMTTPRAKGVTETSLKILWDEAEGNVSGYEIYYSSCYSGTYKYLASVKATKHSYVHAKIAKFKQYYYKVRAYKVIDGKKYYGSFSKVIAAKGTAKSKVAVTKTAVNLRKQAGTGNAKILMIPAGAKVRVYCYTLDPYGNKWYKVTYKTSKKTYTGYSMASYYKIIR